MVRTHRRRPSSKVFCQRGMHSFGEVLWRAFVADLQPFPGGYLGMAAGGLRVQLEYGVRTRARHLASEPHEPLVPYLPHVSSFPPRPDLIQEAVALLPHTFQPGPGS